MTEAFLHYVWQHQMLIGGLTTTDGQPVCVLRPGEPNYDAGPDFFNARLRIGDVEWAGNIEIHIHSSDWTAHRHTGDAAYNNIILHVVFEHDAQIRLQNNTTPPTLELKSFLHPSLVANYESLTAPATANTITCANRLPEVPSVVLHSWLERLTVERIQSKTDVIKRMLDDSRGDWSQTCYWLLARYYGGKVNALAFEMLAKSVDPKFLARWANDRTRVEALLMGQAGFLNGEFLDEYPRTLQTDYIPLSTGTTLRPMEEHQWKFNRLRPSNFPTVRISQFADLLAQTPNPFPHLLEMTDVREIRRFLNRQAATYWDSHYRFDRLSTRTSVKRLGAMQADIIIINAWVPLLFLYGVEHGGQQYKDRALALLAQMPAENNATIRRWRQAGIPATNAAESQALLQLKDNYCTSRRCLECRIGYHILKKK